MKKSRLYNTIRKDYARTIVVGDIHGCYKELIKLLDEIGFTKNDLLIAVGDLVDRGPDSWKVVDFFKDTPNAFSVLGNHERRLAGTIRGTSRPAWSQLHTRSKIAKDKEETYALFLENLPAIIETNHCIVTHARLDPTKEIDKQDSKFTCAVGGYQVKINTDDDGIPLWFHEWKNKHVTDKAICIGHIGYERVELVPGELYALDTGTVKGGMLTAVILPENKVVQVKAEKNYYEESYNDWISMTLDNIGSYKIHNYLKLKEKDPLNEFEQRIVLHFEEELNKLNVEQKLNDIKDKLITTFGEVPEAGVEKGNYFKNIANCLPGNNSRLINMILNKPFKMEYLLKLYQGKNIATMLEELECIDAKIKK